MKRKLNKRYVVILTVCSVVAAICLPLIIWGILSIKAHGSLQGASLGAMYSVAFGFVFLVTAVIIFVIVRSQDSLYRRISATDETDVLLRWECTREEARRFLDSEAQRLKVPRRAGLYVTIAIVLIGIWIAWLQSDNFKLGKFLIGYAMFGGFVALIYFLWRAQLSVEMKDSIARANSEIILTREALVAGEGATKWRGFNFGLSEAIYEAGRPDVLKLVFVAGTLPGSATVGAVAQAAHVAAGSTMPGRTRSTMTIRIPVTAPKADAVRMLVSNELSKYTVTPPVLP